MLYAPYISNTNPPTISELIFFFLMMGQNLEVSDAVGDRKKLYSFNFCYYLQILECVLICGLLKYFCSQLNT